MKKLLSLISAAALVLALAACGAKPGAASAPTANSPSQGASSVSAAPDVSGQSLGAAPGQREYRVQPKGGGEDIVTLMVYLCGSDLESRGGAATIDLIEMMRADIGENVNVVVETGGAMQWATEAMDPTLNQRWQVVSEDLLLLESNEPANMSLGGTLQDFITYSAENFPADRYMLVLWDHGGGTLGGYAYDERYENNSMMSLKDIDDALAGAGVTFDMIGFDCCLMGTAETAFVAEKYADYMVASQRVEPGNGWYYTDWITALSQNPSIPTPELGEVIVDSFLASNAGGYYGSELTLSVLDLSYVQDMFHSMYGFFPEVKASMIDGGLFVQTSKLLGESRAMQTEHDLVDMATLIENMDGSGDLLQKLNQCVLYNGATIDSYDGLCLYFPYTDLYQVEEALKLYDDIGIGEQYQDFVASFANLMLGGQVRNGLGEEDAALAELIDTPWVDEEAWDGMQGFFDDSKFNGTDLLTEWMTVKDAEGEEYEGWVLPLSEEQGALIADIKQVVWVDYSNEEGTYYQEWGRDNNYRFSEDGDLLISFDSTWVAINGQLVPFYSEVFEQQGDEWYKYGTVPFFTAGEDEEGGEWAELLLWWDSVEYPEGVVIGWRFDNEEMGEQKGLFPIEDGMVLHFATWDQWTNPDDPNQPMLDGWVYSGVPITVDSPLTVSYEPAGWRDHIIFYEINDIFNNTYYTDEPIFSYDYLYEDPEVLADAESINSAFLLVIDDGPDVYYASASDYSIALVHDPFYNNFLLYSGQETVDALTGALTITDSESGEGFTFTPAGNSEEGVLMEAGGFGTAVVTEYEPLDMAFMLGYMRIINEYEDEA